MKTPSTLLHELIHSLSNSGKRYVKLFSVHISDCLVIKLFDAIEAQKIYDEVQLKKGIEHPSFVKGFGAVNLNL